MAGTYAVDHDIISDGDGGTVTELNGYTQSRNLSNSDTEIFYRALASHSVNTRNSANSKNSLIFTDATNTTFAAGEVVGMWIFNPYVNSSSRTINQATYGGVQIVFGTGSGNANTALYRIDGADVAGVGGWKYYVVDPRNTPNGEYTNGPFTTFDNYGFAYGQTFGLRRDPLAAINGIFGGRHTMQVTSGTEETTDANIGTQGANSGNFVQMAAYNDYNGGGTAPNGTTLDGGYHKFGIFDGEILPGGFFARGVISIGTAASSVYFQDRNRNIVFSDDFATYDAFNRLEFRNTSSTIEITNCVFSFAQRTEIDDVSSTLRFGTPRCDVEVFNNPTLTLTGCSFNDMRTFIFQSNTTLNDTTLRRCQQATQNGATITSSTFENTTSAASLLVSTANAATDFAKITNTKFNGDGSNHAIEFDAPFTSSSNTTLTWSGNTLTDNAGTVTYTAGSLGDFSNTGADANAAIALVNNGTGTITIDVLNGSDVPSIENTGTGTVTVRETFSLEVTGLLGNSEVRVYDNPSLLTGGASSTEAAGVETVAATTVTGNGSNNFISYNTSGANVSVDISLGNFTSVELQDGDTFRVLVRDNADNPTLQLFDQFTVSGTPTTTSIPTSTTSSGFTSVFGSVINSANSKTVTVEKENVTETFSVGSGSYDVVVYRTASNPIITKNFSVTENSRIPISQTQDRVYKNPA